MRHLLTAMALGSLLLFAGAPGVHAQEADLTNLSAVQLYAEAGKHLTAGDDAGGLKICEYLVQQFPDDGKYAPYALYRICSTQYRASRLTEAQAAGLRVYKEYPDSECARLGLPLFYLTGMYLYRQNNPQAVLDLVKPYFDKYAPDLQSWEWSACCVRVALAYLKQDNPAAARDFLAARLPQCVYLLTNPEYYETAVQIATVQKDNAAALAAARNGYAFCDFDEPTIKRMAELVRKTFMATGDFSKGLQFLASQDDATAPNPLKDIPAPKVSEADRDAILKAVGDKPAVRSLVYSYCGDNARALSEAILYVSQAPQAEAVKSIMTVARVFKAADLGIHRSNQFIEFARTGKGTNPCSDPGF